MGIFSNIVVNRNYLNRVDGGDYDSANNNSFLQFSSNNSKIVNKNTNNNNVVRDIFNHSDTEHFTSVFFEN
jgi:hypothetical protein